jgi:hypothetical protein
MVVGVVAAALMCALASEAGAATWECQMPPDARGKSFGFLTDGRSYIEAGRSMTLEKQPRRPVIPHGAQCVRLEPGTGRCDGQEVQNCFEVSPAGMLKARR